MSSVNDFLINGTVLEKYVGSGGDVVVPETVQRIGSGAFADRADVCRVILPDGLCGIEEDAFIRCSPDMKLEFTWTQFNKLSKTSKEYL